MTRNSPSKPAKSLATAALLTLAITGMYDPASAESRRDRQDDQSVQSTITGPAVMAIVSIKDQRVSLYDAFGGALRARVSSGRTDYETPVGIYSVLQKQEEHYSNVYDDASMPFMQRITWSGVSLHEGQLPGYPASHGCVRLPHSFAEQIFPLTKIGMRVVIARDDVAPVEFSHPLLLKPAPVAASAVATQTAYVDLGSQQQSGSVFQADVRNWPQRQAEMDALKAVAADLASKAELTKAPVETLKAALADKTKQRAAVAKILRVADKAKHIADDKSARAGRDLAAAKDPAKLKKLETAKAKAEAAALTATGTLAKVTTEAQAATGGRQRRSAERTVRAAERAQRIAVSEAARAGRDLTAALAPERFKKQEDAAASAAAAMALANQKYADAAAAQQSAEADVQRATQDLAAAVAALDAAVTAAREAERKTFPVSMFVSLKTQRLYVRQGHEPVIDVPVTIAEPDRPIGTYVFTAVNYVNEGKDLRWTAVSLARRQAAEVAELSNRKSRQYGNDAGPAPTNATAAAAALDRVTLPPEIIARVSGSVWPGSSLIVSDEALSKETGKATDFVVLISGEPQGGIKRRPKPAPLPLYNSYNSYYSSGYGYGGGYGSGYGYGSGTYLKYDRYGRPIRIQQKPKPIFNWW